MSKLVIALPEAAPITLQYEQLSNLTLFVLNGQYEDPSSAEDALVEFTYPNSTTAYFSLKTGQIFPTLPTGAVQVADGAIFTLTQGNGGL